MIEVPEISDSNRLSDWIELYVLSERKLLSKNKIISIMEDNSLEADEDRVDSALAELSRRLQLYGRVKPYEIKENIIYRRFDWKKYPEHALCLIFSTYGAGSSDEGTKLFEQITKACIDSALKTRSVLFGFPATLSFKEQLDTFATEIHEVRGEDPGGSDKDRSVDIITRKDFDDSRPNMLLLFVQCAAGKHWNAKKAVAIPSYRRFFSFTYHAAIPSLSVTQVVDMDDWRNATDDYGIVFDRARLYRMFTSPSYKINAKIRNQITKWCRYKLEK